MPRYIDADALIENIKRVYCTDCNNYNEVRCRACGTDDAITMIDDAPAVDVALKNELLKIYRKKVYRKMEKYSIFAREYIQRIMREVEKEIVGEQTDEQSKE